MEFPAPSNQAAAPAPANPAERGRALEAPRQSLADRDDRRAGRLHGGARHLDRQRRAAAHRRLAGRFDESRHLGADQLPGLERHCAAHRRLGLERDGPPQLLFALRGHLHRLQLSLRRRRRRCLCCWSSAYCKARAAAECSPWRRPSWPTAFPCRSAARPLRFMDWWPFSRRRSAPPWAAGSPTTTPGAGSSSSTFPSAFWPSFWSADWSTIRPGSRPTARACGIWISWA